MRSIQIMGDSQVWRFTQFNSKLGTELRVVTSLAVSGITISSLKRKLKKEKSQIINNLPLILFVGCNDVLKRGQLGQIKKDYLALIKFINRHYPGIHIIVIQIPLMPRCIGDSQTTDLIHDINEFLATLKAQNLAVLRWNIPHSEVRAHFQEYYRGSSRQDLVHLNDKGFRRMTQELINILDRYRPRPEASAASIDWKRRRQMSTDPRSPNRSASHVTQQTTRPRSAPPTTTAALHVVHRHGNYGHGTD